MTKCVVDGCNNEVLASYARFGDESSTKYCRKHRTWLKQRGSLEPTKFSRGSLNERFERRLAEIEKKDDSCWIWTFAKNKKGYGVIGGADKKTLFAHRVSYQYHYGDLESKDYVLHSCDNPSCVNPKHLRKGTCSENIKEAFDKGRKTNPVAFGEDNPKSKLTVEQVRFIKANPQLGHKAIADMFGLSPNCIRGVRIGRTWKDVE